MAVLYRKYRPQTFADVLGQGHIVQTLQNQVRLGQVAHAYLFTGSRGVGKTSVARILAKAVNCINRPEISQSHPNDPKKTKAAENSKFKNQKSEIPVGDACGTCTVCKQIEQGNFPDLVEIDAASNTGVDNIRDLIEHVKFSPSVGKYKVFIIDEVHMLSKGAFNALLKTLEEPPAHALFILATTEINKVPATIVSRTQRFDFRRLSVEELETHLHSILKQEGTQLASGVVELIAQRADGSGRDALSLLDKVIMLGPEASLEDAQRLLGATDIVLSEELAGLIAEGKAEGVSPFMEKLVEQGVDFGAFNRDLLEYFRRMLVWKITGTHQGGLSEGHAERLAGFGAFMSSNDIVFTMRLLLKAYKDLQDSPIPDIPLLLAGVEAAMHKAKPSTAASPSAGTPPSTARPAPPVLTSRETPQTEYKPVERKKPVEEASDPEPLAAGEEEGAAISLSEVQAVWSRFIDGVKRVNGPLGNLIKNSPLHEVRGNKAVVTVKYQFHKQNLEHQKNQALISTTFEAVSGKKIRLIAEVSKVESKEEIQPQDAITDALKIFGGELVE